MTTPSRRRGLATAAAVTLLAITGAACAGSSGDGDAASSADAPAAEQNGADGGGTTAERNAAAPGEVPAEARDGAAFDTSLESNAATTASTARSANADAPALQAAIINTGNVAMRSDDVGQSLFDIGKIVDRYRGQVAEETTETDDDGEPMRSRMTLRVPADTFTETMEDLEDVALLISSAANSQDVTTTVLDKQARIAVQRRSIQRISVLLDQAVTIRDIVNIEAELSRRTAVLASLEKQSRYLADQTSMSTITLSVERTTEKPKPVPPKEEDDDKGFFAGLSTGWDALTKFAVGLATVLGALLPWMIVVALLAIPGWPLLRRLRRAEAAPSSPTEAPA